MSVIFTEEDHSYKSSNQEDLIDWISVTTLNGTV